LSELDQKSLARIPNHRPAVDIDQGQAAPRPSRNWDGVRAAITAGESVLADPPMMWRLRRRKLITIYDDADHDWSGALRHAMP
jgi:hypothetical protein